MQAREQWSEEEAIHLRPGHQWLFEFGDAGSDSSCKVTFSFYNDGHPPRSRGDPQMTFDPSPIVASHRGPVGGVSAPAFVLCGEMVARRAT